MACFVEVQFFSHFIFAALLRRKISWDSIRSKEDLLLLECLLFFRFLYPLGRLQYMSVEGNRLLILVLNGLLFNRGLPVLWKLLVGVVYVLLETGYVLSACGPITQS